MDHTLASLPRLLPELPTAWLSLDADDNDLARFLGALVAALQRLHPALGAGVRPHLHGEPRPIMGLLINDLMAHPKGLLGSRCTEIEGRVYGGNEMDLQLMLKSINLALRFLLELGALAGLGYWGFGTGTGWIQKAGLGLGAPLAAAVLWGTFGSPAAPVPVSGPLRLALEVIILGAGGVALYAAGRPGLAATFLVLAALNRLLMHLWGQ